MGRITSYREVDERYPILRLAGVISSIFGTILLVMGILSLGFSIYLIATGRLAVPRWPGGPMVDPQLRNSPVGFSLGGVVALLWSFGFLLSGVQSLAIGALLHLAVHVEENTRSAAQSLEALSRQANPPVDQHAPVFQR